VPIKKSLTLLFLFAFACSSEPEVVSKPNPEYQLNWKTLNFRGRPEAVYELNFKQFNPDSLETDLITRENFFFDDNGNVERRETYIDNHHPNKNLYEFDQYNNIVLIKHYDERGNFTHKTQHVFDSVGNVKEILNLNDNDKILYKTKRKYDTHGNVIEYQQLEPKSPVIHKRRYEYDEKGRCILKEDIHMRTREVIVYDSTGKVKTTTTYRDNVFSTEERDSVDDRGRKIQSTYRYENTSVRHIYQYDSLDNVLEYIKMTNGLPDSTRSFRNQYQYDQQNNWIKRTRMDLKGNPRNSIERTIVYQ
jgi:hypothetical protein